MLNKLLRSLRSALARPAVWLSLLFLGGGSAGVVVGTWRNICADCPSVAQIRTWEPVQTSKIYSHDGALITEIGIERRTPISIQALPAYVPQAFVAIEDHRFYEHGVVDPRGLARAVFGVLIGKNLGGGSTLTQQLARNMFVERIGFTRHGLAGYLRKLKELQVAMELERAYTKDQILEAYMNEVNFDRGWLGIQTAARNYLGKSATEVNPAEAALLAAIPNLPAVYNPFKHPDNALRRRNLVLDRMAAYGYLSREEADRWKEFPLPDAEAPPPASLAPYFEEWVRQILDDRFGSELYRAGLRVYTTLDVEMQRAAQKAMEQGWSGVEARPEYPHPRYADSADHQGGFPGGVTPYLQGVFVALDPVTGHVQALIGGRDFDQSKFNRAIQAHRQAGSSFKPFVYASAIESGIPASHVLVDAPVVLPQVSGEEWKPRNFTNEFGGPMTIREGLRRSINMIAIKLGLEIGMETVAQTARRLGIQTEVERYPSTAIGAAEVIPIQMAEAYSTFATLGTKVRPFPILRVESADGEVLWEPQPERSQVMDSLVTRIMVSMLEDVVAQGTAHNAVRVRGGLPPELPAAGKTGTTNDGTDVWFVGFTPNLMALTWLGMDTPQPIWDHATGGGDAAPIWAAFMRRVYYGDPDAPEGSEDRKPILPLPAAWPIPRGLTTRQVDSKTGKLASRWCPADQVYTEIYLPGTEPTELCDRSSGSIFGSRR